jgi:hypothetical protein
MDRTVEKILNWTDTVVPLHSCRIQESKYNGHCSLKPSWLTKNSEQLSSMDCQFPNPASLKIALMTKVYQRIRIVNYNYSSNWFWELVYSWRMGLKHNNCHSWFWIQNLRFKKPYISYMIRWIWVLTSLSWQQKISQWPIHSPWARLLRYNRLQARNVGMSQWHSQARFAAVRWYWYRFRRIKLESSMDTCWTLDLAGLWI